MNKNRAIALAAATLVAGLVIGQLSGAFAARSAGTSPSDNEARNEACNGEGMRLGAAMHDSHARMRDIVADLTGLSTEELAEQRASGKSLADIAAAKGVPTEKVVDATLEARKAALDKAVSGGTITRAHADEMLEHMNDRISNRIAATSTNRQGGKGGGGVCERDRTTAPCQGDGPVQDRAQERDSQRDAHDSRGPHHEHGGSAGNGACETCPNGR